MGETEGTKGKASLKATARPARRSWKPKSDEKPAAEVKPNEDLRALVLEAQAHVARAISPPKGNWSDVVAQRDWLRRAREALG